MVAANYDITVEAGSTLQLTLTLKDDSSVPIDLTGYSARMMVRPTVKSPVLYLSLTSGTGGAITITSGTGGTIVIDRSATQTALYKFENGVYDLEIQSSGGTVTRIMEGDFIVSPEVTR